MKKDFFDRTPTIKVFPCDCFGEGLSISIEDDPFYEDIEGGPYMNIAFWGYRPYADNRLSWKQRLRWAWRVFRTGNPWCDMVILNGATAKRFANHIYYLIDKYNANSKKDELKPLTD